MDITQLTEKVEQATKSLSDERQRFEDLSAKVEKGLMTEAEKKELMEKVEKQTDKLEDTIEKMGKMDAAVQRLGKGAEENADANGERLDVKAVKQGLRAFIKSGVRIDLGGISSLGLGENEAKALSNAFATDGGLRVSAERDSEIGRILYDTSPLRSVARVVTTGSNRWEKWVKDQAAGAAWIGELQTKGPQATAKGHMLEVPVHEIYSWQEVTQQHIDDAEYDIMGETSMDAADEIARDQNAAFIIGNKGDRPQGITTASQKTSNPDVYARNKIGTKEAAAVDAVTTDELIDLQDLLKTGYEANASWLMSRKSRSKIRKLRYTSGTNAYIWEPSVQDGVAPVLLGSPVQIMEDMPAMTTGNVSIVYGDIRRAYVIVDRLGLSLLDDPYSGGHLRILKYRARVGGAIQNYDAMKYLKQA